MALGIFGVQLFQNGPKFYQLFVKQDRFTTYFKTCGTNSGFFQEFLRMRQCRPECGGFISKYKNWTNKKEERLNNKLLSNKQDKNVSTKESCHQYLQYFIL